MEGMITAEEAYARMEAKSEEIISRAMQNIYKIINNALEQPVAAYNVTIDLRTEVQNREYLEIIDTLRRHGYETNAEKFDTHWRLFISWDLTKKKGQSPRFEKRGLSGN